MSKKVKRKIYLQKVCSSNPLISTDFMKEWLGALSSQNKIKEVTLDWLITLSQEGVALPASFEVYIYLMQLQNIYKHLVDIRIQQNTDHIASNERVGRRELRELHVRWHPFLFPVSLRQSPTATTSL